jgi:hypothetical protein
MLFLIVMKNVSLNSSGVFGDDSFALIQKSTFGEIQKSVVTYPCLVERIAGI